jgi:hypothetical protein
MPKKNEVSCSHVPQIHPYAWEYFIHKNNIYIAHDKLVDCMYGGEKRRTKLMTNVWCNTKVCQKKRRFHAVMYADKVQRHFIDHISLVIT